jgi:hypothetical protein
MYEVTRNLSAVEQGDTDAAEQPLPLIDEELRQLTAWNLAQEQPGQTLQAVTSAHKKILPSPAQLPAALRSYL